MQSNIALAMHHSVSNDVKSKANERERFYGNYRKRHAAFLLANYVQYHCPQRNRVIIARKIGTREAYDGERPYC